MSSDQPLVLYALSAAARGVRAAWSVFGRASYGCASPLVVQLAVLRDSEALRGAQGGVVQYCVGSAGRGALVVGAAAMSCAATCGPAWGVHYMEGSTFAAVGTFFVMSFGFAHGMALSLAADKAAAAAQKTTRRTDSVAYVPPPPPPQHPLAVWEEAVELTVLDAAHAVLAVFVAVGAVRAPACKRLCRAVVAGELAHRVATVTSCHAALQLEALNTVCCWAAVVPGAVAMLSVGRPARVHARWAAYDSLKAAHGAKDVPAMPAMLFWTIREAGFAVAEIGLCAVTTVGVAATMPWQLPSFAATFLNPDAAGDASLPPPPAAAGAHDWRRLTFLGRQLARCVTAVPETLAAAVVLATVYRAPALIRSWRARGWHNASAEAPRRVGRDTALLVFMDAGTAAAMSVTVVPTLYRLPRCVRIARGAEGLPHRALMGECKELICDLPYLLCAAAASLTHRSPALCILARRGSWRDFASMSVNERRAAAAAALQLAVLDVVAVGAYAVVYSTLWRIPPLRARIAGAGVEGGDPTRAALARRGVLFSEAGAALRGLFSLRSLLPWAAAWRIPTLLQAVEEHVAAHTSGRPLPPSVEADIAAAVSAAGISAPCDVVCVPLRALLWMTRWQEAAYVADTASARGAAAGRREKPSHHALVSAYLTHLAVLRHTLFLVLDAPIVLCVPGALWRWRRVLDSARLPQAFATYPRRLGGAAAEVATAVADVPCAVLYAALCCSWRRAVVRRPCRGFASAALGDGLHAALLRQAAALLIDVPHALLAVASLWRVGGVCRRASIVDDDDGAAPLPPEVAAAAALDAFRAAARQGFALMCADVAAAAVVAPASAVPWNLLPNACEVYTAAVGAWKGGAGRGQPAGPPLFPAVRAAHVRFPKTYVKDGNVCGIEVRISAGGHAPALPPLKKVTLCVDGNAFWKALAADFGALVSAARATLFPLPLSRDITNAYDAAAAAAAGEAPKDIVIALATGVNGTQAMSQATMLRSLEAVKEKRGLFTLRVLYEAEDGSTGLLVPPLTLNLEMLLSQADFAPNAIPASLRPLVDAVQNEAPDDGCPWHALAQRVLLTQYPALLPEAAALGAACCVPWRLPKTLRWLFGFEGRDLPSRLGTAGAILRRCATDVVSVVIVTILTITVWRLPYVYRRLRQKKVATLRGFKEVAREAFKEWCLDCMQFFEVLFIAGTLVQAPATARRLGALFSYRAAQVKVALRLLRAAAAPSRPPTEGAPTLQDLPADCLTHVLKYVERPQDVAVAGAASYALYCAAQDEELWEARFAAHPWRAQNAMAKVHHTDQNAMAKVHHTDQNAMATSAKSAFIARYQSRRERRAKPQTPQHVLDDKQGVRYVIRSEFKEALRRLPHFYCLPFKLAGGALLPVAYYASWRHRKTHHPLSKMLPLSELQAFLASAMKRNAGFWDLHKAFFAALPLIVVTAAIDLAVPLHWLGFAAYQTLTLGAVKWHRRSPYAGDIMLGAGGLLSGLLWLYVCCMRLPSSFHWWAPEGRAELSYLLQYAAVPVMFGARAAATVPLWLLQAAVPAAGYAAALILPFVPYGPDLLAAGSAAAAGAGSLSFDAGIELLGTAFARYVVPQVAAAAAAAAEAVRPTSAALAPYLLVYHPAEALLAVEGLVLRGLWELTVGPLSFFFSGARFVVWLASWRLTVLRLFWLMTWGHAAARTGFRVAAITPSGAEPLRLYRLPFVLLDALCRSVLDALCTLCAEAFGAVWRGYEAALAAATRVCKRLGLLGEVLLFPIAAAWCAWPMAVPSYRGDRALYITAVCLTARLIVQGRAVVKRSW
eukprot:TRINITY_DN688_c2_g1_i1.p1 TRINITY_DN688_c2_g1~~TRINITY_DN688_c2_g1_i1.p1  ORF type:complete len:1800 (+),score=400.22 TRINITY_DN688_c2_g1_i1:64-5463(+)